MTDDRTAAALAQVTLADADWRYRQLLDDLDGQDAGLGFLGVLWQASRDRPGAFVRAGLDPQVRARAAELGVQVPGYADLPPEGCEP